MATITLFLFSLTHEEDKDNVVSMLMRAKSHNEPCDDGREKGMHPCPAAQAKEAKDETPQLKTFVGFVLISKSI